MQDELEEEILFQGLWGQVQVVIGMLQSSLAQSQVQLSIHDHVMYICIRYFCITFFRYLLTQPLF